MKCVFCRKEVNPATEFKDECSKREWGISQICQACQDFTFGPPPKKEEKK